MIGAISQQSQANQISESWARALIETSLSAIRDAKKPPEEFPLLESSVIVHRTSSLLGIHVVG